MAPNPITIHIPYDPAAIETVATRPKKRIEIVEPDPTWPYSYSILESRITAALPPTTLLYVQHVGSTSVPGLPAKAVIDIDIVVRDPTDEESYVPVLEKAGFQFLFRERKWHEHRFFSCDKPYANVHLFGEDSPEVVRHRLFRDWLRDPEHGDDREAYAEMKRRAAKESRERGEDVMQYNDRKEPVIREILRKVYKAHGLLKEDEENS
ncbi:grpb/dephospho-CoA kinase [Aspergillus karnatakaensis]|uniref:GrpB family protein n=1 Tax=Aspergillus karnatakaensis TaxID=1810916 RepID=UPI003CCD7261